MCLCWKTGSAPGRPAAELHEAAAGPAVVCARLAAAPARRAPAAGTPNCCDAKDAWLLFCGDHVRHEGTTNFQQFLASVVDSIPHVQDATFSELLRRLQKLDVDPQLPAAVATAAASEENAEDAATRIRAVCQSSANIDFGAALEIAQRARVAKVEPLYRAVIYLCS